VTAGLPRGITDPEQWVRDQEQRSARLVAEAERVREELASTVVTETSRDGAVSLTVNPGGILTDLRLGRTASDLSLLKLASAIMDTYRRAIGTAADRTTEIMAGLIGEDSDTMHFLRTALPPPENETPRRRRWPGDEGDEPPPRVLR
jgi:hypothetical protein